MSKSIAIIGDSGIAFDARVQRLVKSFASNKYKVDLFLPNTSGNQSIKDFFENNLVRIFIYDLNITWLNKNLLFWKKFQNAHIAVLKTGVNYDFIYINDYPLLYEGVSLKSTLIYKLIIFVMNFMVNIKNTK